MGWIEEALQKAKELEKQNNNNVESLELIDLKDNCCRDMVFKELRSLYENATQREVDKAIDLAIDKLGNKVTKNSFMLFARTKLED